MRQVFGKIDLYPLSFLKARIDRFGHWTNWLSIGGISITDPRCPNDHTNPLGTPIHLNKITRGKRSNDDPRTIIDTIKNL